MVADIFGFSDKSPRQFPLNADLPASLFAHLWIQIEECNAASKTCRFSGGISHWLQYRDRRRENRERLGNGCAARNRRACQRCGACIAGLNRITAALA